MEAGYDYLLMRSHLQQRFFRFSGVLLVAIGAIFLSAGIAYYAYAYKARSDLDKLNYSLPGPILQQTEVPALGLPLAEAGSRTAGQFPFISTSVSSVDAGSQEEISLIVQTSPASVGDLGAEPATVPSVTDFGESTGQPDGAEPQLSSSVIATQQLYPGEAIKATYFSNPLEYEPASYIEASLIQSFSPIDPDAVAAVGTLPAPTRIIIPSVGVDSGVSGLDILDLGDSRAYTTPKNTVGHIPQTANPGERESSWYFGHLESPIAGEGNVFYNLPKIPELLKRQDVYVIVENGKGSYLYRITEAFVVHQDDLSLDYEYLQGLRPEYAHLDPGGANIHLVTCVPKWVYDSRLVISGTLVGERT